MPHATRASRRIAGFFFGILFAALVPAAAGSEPGDYAANQVREDVYRHYLDDLLYTHAGDNRGFGPEHDLAQANIAATFESFGLTVTLEPVTYNSTTYYNVVGTKLGTVFPQQEYIVGAHYDSVGNPGADDNGSGVALVMEAARVLTQYESEYTIRFIAFDREEQGLIGSQDYVLDHGDNDILGMISADMVAYNTGTGLVDIYGRTASNPFKQALSQAVSDYGGLTAVLHGPFDASDHAPFEWYGFPACLLIEDWGNPFYHTQDDNVDTPDYIDYAFAIQITRTVVGFLVDHAGVLVLLADGDYDSDGDVDAADFAAFDACFTGPGGGPVLPQCVAGDFDGDGDIDCNDWIAFSIAWTGPPTWPPFLAACDNDCNGNAVADPYDIADGVSLDCNANAVPDECDIAEGTSSDDNGNGVPDECDLSVPLVVCTGPRYLSMVPTTPDPTWSVALRLIGDPADPAVSCVAAYVQSDGSLGPLPVFQTPDAWSTVQVFSEPIIPDTTYLVRTEPSTGAVSAWTESTTWLWGDVDNNGTVNFSDIQSVVFGFLGDFSGVTLEAIDLFPCGPNGLVNFEDILQDVLAFQGGSYSDTACTAPCP